MAAVRVLSWNLQGSAGLDADAVAAVVGRAAPDLFLAQEVQRGQSRRLASACRFRSCRWAFKHWPIVHRAEGIAVLSPHRLSAATAFVLHHSFPWSWRRRVAIEATVLIEARPVRVINAHLSPHDAPDRRREEIDRVIERRGVVAPIVGGDLNDRPCGPARTRLAEAGWTDAWAAVHLGTETPEPAGGDDAPPDPGATNWTAGDRVGRPPTQRIDAVFVPDGWTVRSCEVVTDPRPLLAAMSDHLPVVADVEHG